MNSLIARLLNIFGEPDCPDPHGYISELSDALKGCSENHLRAAGDRIRDSHRGRSFPAIGVVMDAVKASRAAANIGTVPSNDSWRRQMPPVPMDDYHDDTKERWRKAAEWQKAMADKYGSFDAYLTATAPSRDRQRPSKDVKFRSLSEMSRRIAGERD